ncbi:MAG TPA: O-methyltransferase [Terracidiphilus sp.]|jgi:predicted O-methyltransferase YrrM|nr:O-methyltransferase [Terracidiphilus sp.]
MTKTAQKLWAEVDHYFDRLIPPDPAFYAALAANRKAELPAIDVTPLQGKFLELLVRVSGARLVLEIGTLGGYSTLWLARALPQDGKVITLELERRHAEIARANLQNASILDRVDLRIGRAADLLQALVAGKAAPFDLIFIDADKASYPEYLDWSLKLSRPGTVIVADNVVRDGKVIEPDNLDPNIQGVRRFTDLVAADPRLSSTVLQTVGSKGYDGFALAVVIR